ncbi:hypothetical protein H2203_005400 [Taxawa tesnikishii (nom. ined.)]|nr:hypothetical protein H2203_005400 [Dothideales sp. JES 119]
MEDFVHNDEQTIEVKALKDRLDNLWEKHLQLLDRYDQAQKQLSKHTSSAFFSIAQANFKSPSRARYGQDYYDERMQATRLASIQSTENGQYTISVLKPQANVGQPEPTTIPAAKGSPKDHLHGAAATAADSSIDTATS